MLYQTQNDINAFYCSVIQKVAASSKVSVQDYDLKSTAELWQEISQLNPTVFQLLQKFLATYQVWYTVHVKINNAGTSGNLTPQQNQQLITASQNRNQTRNALINAI